MMKVILMRMTVMMPVMNVISLTDTPSLDSYEVTFEVREFRPLSGGINTLIGNNDASLVGHHCNFCVVSF